MLFCIFGLHKLTEVDDKGYQYCKRCGKAVIPECVHYWELLKKEEWNNKFVTISKCKKCNRLSVYKEYY